MRLEARKYLYDIQDAAGLVAQFTAGKTFDDYRADPMLRFAVERAFSIIGEALVQLTRLDAVLAAQITDSRNIIAFRNILIHSYAHLDDRIVWEIVEYRLPVLIHDVAELMKLPDEALYRRMVRSHPWRVGGGQIGTRVGPSGFAHGDGLRDGLHRSLDDVANLGDRREVPGLLVGVDDAVDDSDGGDDGEDPEDRRHDSPALEEGAENDEDDTLGALHEAYFAFSDESFGASARVADHQRGDHDKGGEEDVEEAIAAGVENQESEEEDDVGVAVNHRIEEGSEDGDLMGLAGDAAVDHVKDSRADDDEAGIQKHADVVLFVAEPEEHGSAGVDDQAESGEDIGRDAGEGEPVNNGLEDHATTGAECASPRDWGGFAHCVPG
jgi:uncharacterized protein with HEPN domain